MSAILFFLMTVNFSAAQNAVAKDSLQVADPAPTFSLPDLDNNYVFLRDYCGTELRKPWINKTRHVVVLSFFATWCAPCKKEIPFLEKLMDEYEGKPVKFYLIDVGEEPEKVRTYIEQSGVRIPVLIDRYMRTAEKYGATALPRLAVINKDGMIIKLERGFSNGSEFLAGMRAFLSRYLTEASE
jgi:thiol-disulfide isomerase/thioredoxin